MRVGGCVRVCGCGCGCERERVCSSGCVLSRESTRLRQVSGKRQNQINFQPQNHSTDFLSRHNVD